MDVAFEHRIPDPGLRRKAITLLIEKLIERNYILCHVGGAQFAFVHRGFLEFFCAEKIKQLCAEGIKPPIETAVSIFQERGLSDAWIEVLVLAAVSLPPPIADAALVTMVEESGKKLENSWSELEENDLARLKLAVNALRHSRDRKNLPRTDASIRTLIEKELNSETPSVATLYCLQFLGWLGPDEHAAAVLEEIVKEGNSSVLVPMAFWALATIRPNRRTLLLGRAALHLPMHGTFSDCWIKSLQETIMCVPFQRNDLIDVLIGLAEGSDLSLGEWARARLEEINQCHTYEPAEIPIRTIQARKTGTEAVKRGEAAFAWAHSLFSASTVRGEA